jgi:hypothetical protein
VLGIIRQPARQILAQRRRDSSATPLDSNALCDPQHRRDQQRIFLNIDRLTSRKARFHLLGKDGNSAEAPNELKARFTRCSAPP